MVCERIGVKMGDAVCYNKSNRETTVDIKQVLKNKCKVTRIDTSTSECTRQTRFYHPIGGKERKQRRYRAAHSHLRVPHVIGQERDGHYALFALQQAMPNAAAIGGHDEARRRHDFARGRVSNRLVGSLAQGAASESDFADCRRPTSRIFRAFSRFRSTIYARAHIFCTM